MAFEPINILIARYMPQFNTPLKGKYLGSRVSKYEGKETHYVEMQLEPGQPSISVKCPSRFDGVYGEEIELNAKVLIFKDGKVYYSVVQ